MIKGISYLSFENGLSNNESIESALSQTQSNGFDALELSVSNEGVIKTSTAKVSVKLFVKKLMTLAYLLIVLRPV